MPELNVIVRRDRETPTLYAIDDQVTGPSRDCLRTLKVAEGDLGIVDAGAIIFAWTNPEPNLIIVREVIINITTVATAAATMDVDVVNSAILTGNTIYLTLDLNAAAVAFSSHNVTDTGNAADAKPRVMNAVGAATNAWITGSESGGQPTDGLVGKYYIYYTEL